MTPPVVDQATPDDAAALAALWSDCGLTRPHNDPLKDIAQAMTGPSSVILVAREGASLAASAMVGHDGHRGWVYYVAVRPDRRGTGLGRAVMDAAEAWLAARGVWKAMLMIRETNTPVRDFYAALGYAEEPRTVMSKAVIPPHARP
jgi:GNAT superfamily N-acetyltransferase